ncbi:hypothetical protein MmiEs2_05840 [Methanimicrococcus stummii]|uniref:Uncharacterized protein n=1 Tax=Methanimicrococcus stummii TaxID=3028294 RepID=A0AA96ZX04_9EURY|nr:hypothetical protein [Methanimicrococcus sp. Es2]WNY28399.1 hypothetical protein MmiEs2_05840 [Methanimicrococcus sp. Es2]
MRKCLYYLFFAILLGASVFMLPGSLENAEQNDPRVYARTTCYENNGDILCRISYTIDNGDYEADKANVTSDIIGSDIKINLPLKEKEENSDSSTSSGTVVINIGSEELFEKEIMYTFFENETKIGSFIFEDGELSCYTSARVDGIELISDGEQIKAAVQVSTGVGPVYSVDAQNVTISNSLNESGLYTISLPEKEKFTKDSEAIPFMSVISVYTFEIANAGDLKNGEYTVKINDKETSFTIKNSGVSNMNNVGYVWISDD